MLLACRSLNNDLVFTPNDKDFTEIVTSTPHTSMSPSGAATTRYSWEMVTLKRKNSKKLTSSPFEHSYE